MGVATKLIQRAIALTIALIIVVFLTASIMTLSGYDEKVYRALIEEQVRAFRQALLQKPTQANITEIVERYRQQLISLYGLDKPPIQRVIVHVKNILMLNLGNVSQEDVAGIVGVPWPAKVSDVIAAALPRTILMITLAELICAAIALPLAPLIAYKRGKLLDKFVVSYAAAFNAIPVWWLAMIFILVLGHELKIAPTNYREVLRVLGEFAANPVGKLPELLYYAYVPITVVVICFLGSWFYSIRAMVLRIVAEDFVMVAKAKGLPDRLIARRHILRPALPSVMTMTILSLAASIGGFIITESVFDWPGMGSLYYYAITLGDTPTVLGLIFVTTLVYVVARFVLEVLYIILDPRVRL